MLTRFAPTPSGYLHIGNAWSFLITWLIAKKNNGKILLRIDDLDASRMRPEYLRDIFESLSWLGLDWDLGPKNVQDFLDNFSQTKRVDLYQSVLDSMAKNNLVYACECSRTTVSNCQCSKKKISLDAIDHVWRINPENKIVSWDDQITGTIVVDLKREIPDCVIRKKDHSPAYQIASVVDDAYFKVTDIVRGKDLSASTGFQSYVAKKIGIHEFSRAKFYHHGLLISSQKGKLSKSVGALSLQHLRQAGSGSGLLYAWFSKWMGLEKVCRKPQDFLQDFEPKRFSKNICVDEFLKTV